MQRQHIISPSHTDLLPFIFGPNDGGISRGDRADTGDEQAQPTEKGSGDAIPTVDGSAFGGASSISRPPADNFDIEEERDSRDGIEIMEPGDGRLGLTNYGDKPAEDWAADTGETKTPE